MRRLFDGTLSAHRRKGSVDRRMLIQEEVEGVAVINEMKK